MKTKILLSIICVCSLFEVQAQRWGYDNSFEGEIINKIWTQGLDTVYMVGVNLIAKSTDRGYSWRKQHINDFMLRAAIRPTILTDVCFFDQNNGFVISDDGTILKTINGGDTWEKKESNTYQALWSIAHTGLDNVWVVGEGIVLHSTDFGETWAQIVIDANQKCDFNSVVFRDSIGYITGREPAVLYKTEDKGQTWSKQLIDNQLGIEYHSLCLTANKAYMYCSFFPNPQLSYLFQSLYQSQDYQNWHETPLSNFSRSMSFINDSTGYSFYAYKSSALNIEIFKTEDEGKNWVPVEVEYGPSDYLDLYRVRISSHHIRIVNDTIGYAVSGSIFCRTPAPDYDSWAHIEEYKGPDSFISLYYKDSDLLIKSKKLPIVSVQIVDISGKILNIQKWNTIEEYEKSINTSTIPKGLYIVKTIVSDNTICASKWIKNN